mgnify:CR=1 FL=1
MSSKEKTIQKALARYHSSRLPELAKWLKDKLPSIKSITHWASDDDVPYLSILVAGEGSLDLDKHIESFEEWEKEQRVKKTWCN